MWYGGCEMKRNEIAPTVIIVLLSIVIMVQAVMAENLPAASARADMAV